jgi:hypothetical protein
VREKLDLKVEEIRSLASNLNSTLQQSEAQKKWTQAKPLFECARLSLGPMFTHLLRQIEPRLTQPYAREVEHVQLVLLSKLKAPRSQRRASLLHQDASSPPDETWRSWSYGCFIDL